jgi:hypothetical protein
MPTDDTGVTELLRRASDGLTPDVDRLVSGGIARGRRRRRRARIGTTVASLAVIGVVGGLAVVVPHLGGADSARDPGVASDGGGVVASETVSPTPTETPTPDASVPRDLAPFRADRIPAIVDEVLATTRAAGVRSADPVLDEPDQKFAVFLYDGMNTSVGMNSVLEPSLAGCQEEAAGIDGACVRLADGTVEQVWGPTLADGVTCQGASAYRHGYVVWATSCNAVEAKDSPALAAEPPIEIGLLERIVLSDVWFE